MTSSILQKLRDRFTALWVKPSDAAHVMARAAAEKRQRARLTEQERRDALHARLKAERDTPQWVQFGGTR